MQEDTRNTHADVQQRQETDTPQISAFVIEFHAQKDRQFF